MTASAFGSGRSVNARPRKPGGRRLQPTVDISPDSGGQPPLATPSLPNSRYAFSEAKKQRRLPGAPRFPPSVRQQAVLQLPHGQRYTQAQNPRPLAGHVGVEIIVGSSIKGKGIDVPSPLDGEDLIYDQDQMGFDDDAIDVARLAVHNLHRHQRRRTSQWHRWSTVVIPSLIRPYLEFKHATRSGAIPPPPPVSTHTCPCSDSRKLHVTLATWNSFENVSITVCHCRTAALQLLELGFFPCAPSRPTIAFHLDLLQLITLQLRNGVPNITAWAETLDAFWRDRGFVIPFEGTLRRRLANALQWYQFLVHQANALVTRSADVNPTSPRSSSNTKGSPPHNTASLPPSPRLPSSPALPSAPIAPPSASTVPVFVPTALPSALPAPPSLSTGHSSTTPTSPPKNHSTRTADAGHSATSTARPVFGPPPPPSSRSGGDDDEERPSAYLRARCPLCFGGRQSKMSRSTCDAHACLDGCFGHKRRAGQGLDPEIPYDDSRFLPDDLVREMMERVEKARGEPKKTPKKSEKHAEFSGLPVSNSVLDHCEATFIAAQENVAKSSKKFYSDTGLMALLCRHDRVLWLVNLTTPGERQHYALALIVQLFLHLPSFWRIGLLYDIACQLHRSLVKWDLLPEYLHRLVFGVSVFHAYGHQWPCQLVYHPRKRIEFGLTDGEGCERFWFAISPLIPSLRVSGYYRRLFVLDCQLIHLEEISLARLGAWLVRRSHACKKRLEEAVANLKKCGIDVDTLRSQWHAQVKAQTEKAPRQSKNIADRAVEEVVLERAKLEDAAAAIVTLETRLSAIPCEEEEAREAVELDLQSARTTSAQVSAGLKTMEKALGVTGKQQLAVLKGDPYLRARMNARALRSRIRARIIEHKFERTKIERAFRRQMQQEKNHAHTNASIHRRKGSIMALIRKFNKLVDDMKDLRRDGKAPIESKLPRKLDSAKIFQLDVDDDLWQDDPGLGDDTGDAPGWLGNDKIRDGIVAMLEQDRCLEEEERLQHERGSMQEWITSEVRTITAACMVHQDDKPLLYQLERRLARLRELNATWKTALEGFDMPKQWPFSKEPADPSPDHVYARAGRSRLRPNFPTYASDSSDSSDSETVPDENEPAEEILDNMKEESAASSSDESLQGDADETVNTLADAVTKSSLYDNLSHNVSNPASLRDGAASLSVARVSPAPSASRVSLGPRVSPASLAFQSEPSGSKVKSRSGKKLVAQEEVGRQLNGFWCLGEDMARVASRTMWFSGSAITLFAELRTTHARGNLGTRVYHLPTTFMTNIGDLIAARQSGDEAKVAALVATLGGSMANVCTPLESVSWLIPTHVPSHWTLLEVRWDLKQLRHYDSLPERPAAIADTMVVAQKARIFLQLMCEAFGQDVQIQEWNWKDERRPTRQFNTYDCGPFTCADIVSLAETGLPSTMTQDDMEEWRATILKELRGLEPRVIGKRARASDFLPENQEVIFVD